MIVVFGSIVIEFDFKADFFEGMDDDEGGY
jgi:hypothetical protein